MVIVVKHNITGTLIWYYFICQREVWLMAHQIIPDQNNDLIILGRIIAENSYDREKKEVRFENFVVDIISKENRNLIIAEVKKSSKYLQSAIMQLKFYLWQLSKYGIDNVLGQLRIPREKKVIEISLNETDRREIENIVKEIENIIKKEKPPQVVRSKYCRNCGYYEFCWI